MEGLAVPNGWDRNWVRFVLTVAGFREEFGHWPSAVRMNPQMLKHLSDLFSPAVFRALQTRIKLIPDDAVDVTDFYRAEDSDGHSRYYGGVAEGQDEARAWLGVEPDNPHNWTD
jgi:hypothetical protein